MAHQYLRLDGVERLGDKMDSQLGIMRQKRSYFNGQYCAAFAWVDTEDNH